MNNISLVVASHFHDEKLSFWRATSMFLCTNAEWENLICINNSYSFHYVSWALKLRQETLKIELFFSHRLSALAYHHSILVLPCRTHMRETSNTFGNSKRRHRSWVRINKCMNKRQCLLINDDDSCHNENWVSSAKSFKNHWEFNFSNLLFVVHFLQCLISS